MKTTKALGDVGLFVEANADVLRQLKAHLEGAPCNCYDVRPCVLTIGKQRWAGCHYKQDLVAPDGCRNPGPYTRESWYWIGALPRFKKNRKASCIRIPVLGAEDDYYVAGYADEKAVHNEEFKQYHPFGLNWLMSKWDVPDGSKIDTYERFPYVRNHADYAEAAV